MEMIRRIVRRAQRVVLWVLSKSWKPHAAPEKIRRVIVLELTRLGDVVASTVLAEPLKKAYPGASLEWWVGQGLEGLFENLPDVKVRSFPKSGPDFFFCALGLRNELRDPSLLLVSASPALRHSLLAFLSRPARALGYLFPAPGDRGYLPAASPQDRFVGHKVDGITLTGNEHMVARDLRVLEVADIKIAGARPGLGKSKGGRKGIVLHPGANWKWRRWPLDRYIELGLRLSKKATPVTMIMDKECLDGAGWSQQEFESRCGIDVKILRTDTLAQLMRSLAGARLFVGNDSGPMHLAAALGIPCLGLFGPNTPQRSGPWPLPGTPGSPHKVLHRPPPCCPCDQVQCTQPEKWCMADLSVDDVYKAATGCLRAGR